MSWIKKYVGLHYQCSRQAVNFGLLYIALMEVMMIFSSQHNNNNSKIYGITGFFYLLIMLAMFIISVALNNISIKVCAFFRSSRKKYYISAMTYISRFDHTNKDMRNYN